MLLFHAATSVVKLWRSWGVFASYAVPEGSKNNELTLM